MEEKILEVAVRAATEAGAILEKYYQEIGIARERKSDKSVVTKADLESEAAIMKIIKQEFPDHAVLGEESGDNNATSPYKWFIDPLDATANFVNGIPMFAVSIGVFKDSEPEAAAIFHPATGELYSAARGKGACYNGKKVKVSNQTAGEGLVTFGISKEMRDREHFTNAFIGLEKVFSRRRHLGATSLEMAFIARGGVEATVSFGTKLWDHAAGAVLILEAGGTITDFSGKPWKLGETHFVASNGICHAEVLKIFKDF